VAAVQVTIDDTTHEVELSSKGLTLKESVRLQRALGNDGWDEFTQGVIRPDTMQAIIFVKLGHLFPDLKLDDFDIDLDAAFTAFSSEDDPGNE